MARRIFGIGPLRAPITSCGHCEERAEHLRQVLGAVLDYGGAIVADTGHVATGKSINRKYVLARSRIRFDPQCGG
jgi:hypothetical protein